MTTPFNIARLGLGLLLVVVALAGGASTSCRRTAEPLGALTRVDEVDFAPYFQLARAIVAHGPRPATVPPRAAADRVFVTLWAPGREPRLATALGPTLFDAVSAASETLAAGSSGNEFRLEIDVVTAAQEATLDATTRVRTADIGVFGYAMKDGAGGTGWMLPREILENHLFDEDDAQATTALASADILDALRKRVGATSTPLPGSVFRIEVDARLEPAAPGGAPIRLFRSMPPHPTTLTPEALLQAVRVAGDYLAGAIDDRGAFRSSYDPIRDRVNPRSDVLRSAGSIYALLEAYEELHVPRWLERATLALGYLAGQLTATPDGMYLVRTPEQEQRSVGANGLALIAFVEHARATGDPRHRDTMRALAKFIIHQQYADGHFRQNADVAREAPAPGPETPKTEIYYYAGEATLGLVRLFMLDHDPAWLAAARKSADYLISVRDVHDDLAHQIPDHWLSYALRDLYVLTRESSYADHAKKIANAIYLAEPDPTKAPYPDLVGSFREQGETTPTSVRLEALASTFQLTRILGQDERKIRENSMRLAGFTRGQQLDPDSVYFAKDPARALGGVRASLLSDELRIDYTQHALSGWLRLARLLRDPSWTGDGAPPPSRAVASLSPTPLRPARDSLSDSATQQQDTRPSIPLARPWANPEVSEVSYPAPLAT